MASKVFKKKEKMCEKKNSKLEKRQEMIQINEQSPDVFEKWTTQCRKMYEINATSQPTENTNEQPDIQHYAP